jgi:hypothetical protein
MKDKAASKDATDRKARLAEQLRANLQRRKAQARARRSGEADERQGLTGAEGGKFRKTTGRPDE